MRFRTPQIVLAVWAVSASAEPIATTICDVVQAPAQYDGKMVRVRGTVLSGFEIFALRDAANGDCRVALEYAGGGPVASTSFGVLTPSIERPAVELRRDAAFARFQRALDAEMFPRHRDVVCVACLRYEVTASLPGRIDVAGDHQGFGHLNAFPVRFVLAAVADVAARDRAKEYDQDDYSPTPVRFPTGSARSSQLVLTRTGEVCRSSS